MQADQRVEGGAEEIGLQGQAVVKMSLYHSCAVPPRKMTAEQDGHGKPERAQRFAWRDAARRRRGGRRGCWRAGRWR